MYVEVNNAFDKEGGGKRCVDVYLLVIAMGDLLATGAARAGAVAVGVADLTTVSPDRYYL